MTLSKPYPFGKFIAHAGGSIEGAKYTNSLNAFERSAQSVGLIELDLCRAADGLIIAHDGLEKAYGLTQPFSDVAVSDFTARRYSGRFTPMSLVDLCDQMKRFDVRVILDLKADNAAQFEADLSEIHRAASSAAVLDRIIPQVYSIENYNSLRMMGFKSFILALWKNFPNVHAAACLDCIDHCFEDQDAAFQALSLAVQHVWKEGHLLEQSFTSRCLNKTSMIFIHGQPAEAETDLVENGFGLFSHEAVSWVTGDKT